MKAFTKSLSLVLALLMLVMCFASCGGGTETETEAGGSKETQAPVITETEDPRQAVKDDIPKDLTFADTANNTVTFFIRDDTPMWNNEIDVDEITDDSLWDAIYKRNQTVENRLGVTITTIGQPGTWGPHTQWFQTLRNAVSTKSGDFDAVNRCKVGSEKFIGILGHSIRRKSRPDAFLGFREFLFIAVNR